MANVRVVDVMVQMHASAFEPIFSYLLPEHGEVAIGNVVRVPLGKRENFGYVVSEPREIEFSTRLRALELVEDAPEAFNDEGLRLARWMVETYCCSLSDALSTIIFTNAIPRTVERIIAVDRSLGEGKSGFPERLVELLFDAGEKGMALEEVFRHPEARRAADRPGLRKALTRLVSLGVVRRERITQRAAIAEREERRLRIGTQAPLKGKKSQELMAFVAQYGNVARAEARTAGFSNDVIARAVSAGALIEERVEKVRGSAIATVSAGAKAHADIVPTHEQVAALEHLQGLLSANAFAEVLLHGITGSGKTYVYLETIRRIVAQGDRAIILVPEISLTPQTAARFEALFGNAVVVLHSALGERERFEAWRAAQAGEIQVVVGARSAVFVPLPRLKAIVIDEAHETSYRQDQTPRYHAIAVARERLRHLDGLLILGSATPPLEIYARAKLGKIESITLTERATKLPLPATQIIDLAEEARNGNKSIFSTRLVVAIAERLRNQEKSVLFVNRRGTAKFVLCRSCGFVPHCRRCTLSLTYHRADGLLRCHMCDAQEPMPERCLKCGHAPMAPLGLGTERVTTELTELFPDARIVRMDSDTTTRVGDHAKLLHRFEHDGDILVGTQMIAKGLDFPTVTLAAIVAADVGLHVADYRASERTFALLTQVAGRSGRSRLGEALIQSYLPDHPAVQFAALHDYQGFAKSELAERRMLRYPPFARLAYITLLSRERDRVLTVSTELAQRLQRTNSEWEIMGPAFASVPRINNEWRIRIAIKAQRLDPLRAYLRDDILPWIRKESHVRCVLELDV